MDSGLQIFIKVVELNSFTKAANVLHMTQPAVSQAVRNLEKEFNTTLLEREHKTFYLNQAGEIVYTYAKEITATYHHMQTLIKELEEDPKGDLIIGASYTIGEYILPEVLSSVYQLYPKIHPQVSINNTQTILNQLLNHDIDIGLVEGNVADERLYTESFMIDQMYVVGSGQKEYNVKSITDLAEENWIIREVGSGTRALTEKVFEQYHLEPQQCFTFGSTQIIKEVVESGLGVSLLSKSALVKELQLETIQMLPVAELPIERPFFIMKRKQSFETKRVQVFEQLLHQLA